MSQTAKFGPVGDFTLFSTASDTTTVIDGSVVVDYRNVDRVMFTGTGVMQIVNLGDARRYRQGKAFLFVNQTPEIVGVYSGTSVAVWHRVPPRWSLALVLTDNTTAEGTWFASLIPNPSRKNGGVDTCEFGSFFSGNNYYSEAGWAGYVSGGTNTQYSTGDPAGRVGIAAMLSTTAAQYAGLVRDRFGTLGTAARSFRALVSKSAINAAGNETTIRIGWGDNITAADFANGVFLQNNFTSYGNFWTAKTIAAAGANTVTVSAAVPAVLPNWDDVLIEVASGGVRAEFFANRALIASHVIAANIPGPTIPVGEHLVIKKIADANARTLYVDYTENGTFPVTARG